VPAGFSIVLALFQDQNVVIEAILFLAFVVAIGAGVVKAYEWHQDLLYGRYVRQKDWNKTELK
jgi:hypothetical protein